MLHKVLCPAVALGAVALGDVSVSITAAVVLSEKVLLWMLLL